MTNLHKKHQNNLLDKLTASSCILLEPNGKENKLNEQNKQNNQRSAKRPGAIWCLGCLHQEMQKKK